jgi:hypothetical protein
MRLGPLIALVVVSSLAGCTSSEEEVSPVGVEKRARLDANGSTVVASWVWAPTSGADETRFRISRDGGRTFGPTRTLGDWTSAATISVTSSGRVSFFYRRVIDPKDLREGSVRTAIEAAFVEPASDVPSVPVAIAQARFDLPGSRGTPEAIAVTDRPSGGFTLAHYDPSKEGAGLEMLTSSADGTRWSSLDTGSAFEVAANDVPLFVQCRGTSTRPVFVVKNMLDGRVAVRLEDGDGRWPLERAIEIVAPRAAPGADTMLPGLPNSVLPAGANAIRGCSIDGDRVALLFDAEDRTSQEHALWLVAVTLADAKVASPVELPGSRKRFVDARLFSESGRLFAAATLPASDPRCDVVVWSGDGTFPAAATVVGTTACGTDSSPYSTDGFGLAASGGAPLVAVTRFDDESALRAHVDVVRATASP